jgi:hypothetical protein
MGDFPHYFDIILFAMVAAFLVLRLRSVLGRRTGNERRRDPLIPGPAPVADKIVALARRQASQPAIAATAPPPGTVAAGLAQIVAADPNFDAGSFVDGARGAFGLIVAAFANGDKTQLRTLLSDDTYKSFAPVLLVDLTGRASASPRSSCSRQRRLPVRSRCRRLTQTCCGQPAYNSGDRADIGQAAIARQTIAAFGRPTPIAITSWRRPAPAPACCACIIPSCSTTSRRCANGRSLAAGPMSWCRFLVDIWA